MNRFSILIIEDNIGDAGLIKNMLNDLSSDVIYDHASSLSQAFESINHKSYDAILLDLNLPDSYGKQTLKLLNQKFPYIPIVVLTGNDDIEMAHSLINEGAQDYLNKNELIENITSALLYRTLRFASERKKAAIELEKRELNFKNIIENSKESLLVVDKSGTILFANEKTHKLYNKQYGELINTKFIYSLEDNSISKIKIESETGDIFILEMDIIEIQWEKSTENLVSLHDISEKEMAVKKDKLMYQTFFYLNRINWDKNPLKEILDAFKEYTDIQNIGLRIFNNIDNPIIEKVGTSDDFSFYNNISKDLNQNKDLIKDSNRNSELNVFFTEIIQHQNPVLNSYYSENFSFWTNNLSKVIAEIDDKESPIKICASVISEKFQSFALVPIRSGDKTIAMLQFYDSRPNKFTLPMIQFFEGLSGSIGVALNRIKMMEELEKAKEKAEESDRLKSAFISNMSHEIRTPLNGIVGFAELLQNTEIPNEKRAYYIDIINNSSNQLINIIEDIIDISKIESGQRAVKPTEIEVNNLLKDIYDAFHLTASQNNIFLNVNTQLLNKDVKIITDEFLIKQSLVNLVSNALKFTHKGGVTLDYFIENNNIIFKVSDTGIGIEQQYHDQIFERFKQVDYTDSRDYGGTGLGLAITKANIELLNGGISLFSEVGNGSIFTISIPLNSSNNQSLHQISKSDTILISEGQLKNKTILIVEDVFVNSLYIRSILELDGAYVQLVRNGLEAVEAVKENNEISLVLMDIKLPKMNGYEATKIIKSIRPDLPVIAITAFTFEDDKEKCFKSGCSDYLSKPIKKEELIHSIMNQFIQINENNLINV